MIVFSELWCVESRVAVYFQRRVLVSGARLAVANSHVLVFHRCPKIMCFFLRFIKTMLVFSDL